jgi:hypothetical protein
MVSVIHPEGLTSASLKEAKKEYIIAILFAPSWEPTNKKFFLLSARAIHNMYHFFIQLSIPG